jgi:DNA end-binding protein Ku
MGGKTYYLTPDGPVGQKPYNLLMKGMAENGVYGIAEVVISQKEQVVLIQPVEGLLAMTVLNRMDEVKPASSFKDEIKQTEATDAETSLADTLIKASIITEFDFSRYKDVYKDKLTKLIQMKIEGKEVIQVRDPEEPKIINLMEALKRSVAEAQAAGGAQAAAPEIKEAAKAGLKQAPSAKPARVATAKAATASKKKKVG